MNRVGTRFQVGWRAACFGRLLRSERGGEQLVDRSHIDLTDLHAKAYLMRRTDAPIEEVQREHLAALERRVTETSLQVGE
jgi:hypothetical protein